MLPLLPFVTAHVWPVGCVLTVTFQPSPEVNPVGNVNGPLPSADNVCVPAVVVSVSFRSTLFEPVRPLTPAPAAVPATVYVTAPQLGNLNEAIQVVQLYAWFALKYSLVYQKVQSSTGSTVIAL